MREFVSMVASPIPVLYLFIIIFIIFKLFKKKLASRVALYIIFFWIVVITTKPVPYLLTNNLEKQYRQLDENSIAAIPDSINIIVLGAGHSDDRDLSPNNQLNLHAMMRLGEGIRLQKKIPGSKLILSGFGYRTNLPGAVVMYRTALMFGLDSSSLSVSDMPMTTNSEAEQYVLRYGTNKKLVLVTSAIHMPRAMMLFESKGLDVIPAPTDFIIRYPSRKYKWRWMPAADYTEWMEQAVHEYGGIMLFKAGGK